MKPKIIILDHVVAHYRRDVFNKLLQSEQFDFEIVAGESYQEIKSYTGNFTTFPYRFFSFLGKKFYFLRHSIFHILKQKPDALIIGGYDPHLIHTLIIFIIYRLILRKPLYWWTHGSIGNQGEFGFKFRKWIYTYSSGALAYSIAGKNTLLEMGLPLNKIRVVGNSINTEDYGFINQKIDKRNNETFHLLFAGRITPEKNLDTLLYALLVLRESNRLEYMRCTIVGGGEYLMVIEKMISDLSLNDIVQCTGPKYGSEISSYFQEADLFVYPSGIGLSIVQALSFGIPVITTDNAQLHGPEIEMLIHEVNGDVFKHNFPENLADKICEWKSKIRSNAQEIAQSCIKSVQEKGYLPDKVAFELVDFLKQESTNW